jgi:predicted O-methyltransferase YrrM
MKLIRSIIAEHLGHSLIKKLYELYKVFQIATHLTAKEKYRLYQLAINKKYVLEIGSYTGASTCCFAAAMKNSGGGKVFCIDTWNNDSMSEGHRDTWKEFQSNTENYKDYLMPIRGFSTSVVDEVSAHIKSLDLLFIDGDHSYEGVKSDWKAYKHFLRSGSTVVFHDSGWAEGVKQVIAEDVIPFVSSSGCLPNMWWGVIK